MAENLIESYRKRAESFLKAARVHYDNWDYVSCIHSAQMAVELTLKALLKKFTGDFPKKHDVGDELMRNVEKLPDDLRKQVGRLWFISKVLASWREPSIYGLEAEQVAPETIFKKGEAELAIRYAEEVRSLCFPYLY